MRILASLLLAALAIGAARPPEPDPKGEAALAKMLAGRVAGKPSDCLSEWSTHDVTVIDHTALVYRDGTKLWVNRPTNGLAALDQDTILVTKSYTMDLCKIDPVYLVDRNSHFMRSFVSLGDFVPYTKPKTAN